jgi:hypothetical protein
MALTTRLHAIIELLKSSLMMGIAFNNAITGASIKCDIDSLLDTIRILLGTYCLTLPFLNQGKTNPLFINIL